MSTDARSAMDHMYRYQRHFYDFTRKYYLFGRDSLIQDLPILPGETICEVGCGTARNLITLAHRFPHARLYGIDASDEMLKTAQIAIDKAGLTDRIKVAQALAQDFDGRTLFGLNEPFDRLLFSYSLSMIDEWQAAIDYGITQIKSDGFIHIVDFGNQDQLPKWFKKLLGAWLSAFHVRFRPEIRSYFDQLADTGAGRVSFRNFMRGYAYLLTFERVC